MVNKLEEKVEKLKKLNSELKEFIPEIGEKEEWDTGIGLGLDAAIKVVEINDKYQQIKSAYLEISKDCSDETDLENCKRLYDEATVIFNKIAKEHIYP